LADNGDKNLVVTIGKAQVVGIGSFHKSLPHNEYGEVNSSFPGDPPEYATAFDDLLAATASPAGALFQKVPPLVPQPKGPRPTAPLTNPTGGLASDQLVGHPSTYTMPPAPPVLSDATAAEMVELYWMALLRDVPFNEFETNPDVAAAVNDLNVALGKPNVVGPPPEELRPGIDLPDNGAFTPANLFRLGLPGEETGPMLSQFFTRPVDFGTQTIDVRQLPYRAGEDYLTTFDDWLHAQNTGQDRHGNAYPGANEFDASYYDDDPRYISTMRDLARFVNKDALHQAYFNAALLLLSGGAMWTPGNPFHFDNTRDAGFGVLGGPHILALVSEVATRALKTVWHQKWQVHLRLRPEAYGGLAHVQKAGAPGLGTRAYGLPDWLFQTDAAKRISAQSQARHRGEGYLLPMAFSPGSPTHPAYGAGHATVAGACVTVLKGFFNLFKVDMMGVMEKDGDGQLVPLPFSSLKERHVPYGPKSPMKAYLTGHDGVWQRFDMGRGWADQLTIEGELNKLAHNVAMGRSIGGVHWRTDNARSLILGEALAAEILRDIAKDVDETVTFTFRTFARDTNGHPKLVEIDKMGIQVNGGAPISDSEL
jgi:hypothetical protein